MKKKVEEADFEEREQVNTQTYTYSKPRKRLTESEKIIGLLALILIIIIVFLFYSIVSGKFNFSSNGVLNNNNSNVEIKYSETTEPIEGVYITDVSEIVENVMPSIVAITSKTLVNTGYYGFFYYGTQQYQEGAGSGIIIAKTDSELLILTNNHVVEDAEELVVTFIDDENVNATIKGTSSKKDVAVISVKLNDIKSSTLEKIRLATLGNSNNLKVGQGVVAIGNALGYGQSVTTGVVSALNREVTIDDITNKMIQIDAAINGGNSGGALLNSVGEVIGINSAKYSSSSYTDSASIEGMGFAIPISDITELIETLSNGEEDTNGGKIGITGREINEQYAKAYNMPQGFYITSIEEGTDAAKSGLEIGYIIVKIDDEEVETYNDLSNYLYTKKPGDKVTLTVSYASGRQYKEKEIEVTLY